uniref:Uncharacterized protein n=1 Tax=Nelumbo nucifera TaxID=4432 RepID=A0A822XS74_NELNU|nr:TPA_asm: hypothetical protein HUJ06_024315 [Nelumbo nucifera]
MRIEPMDSFLASYLHHQNSIFFFLSAR